MQTDYTIQANLPHALRINGHPSPGICLRDIMPAMLPDLQLDDIVRLRKPHPCGGYEWKIVRMGADIGMECLNCGRRVLLPRRKLARRLKSVLNRSDHETHSN